jgi:CO dehydrogenase/acetyl-CoA synthase beta subunit
MSHQALRKYVLEIISHQINDTIGKEEEIEAWKEMTEFFGEQFEIVIQEIQNKYSENNSIPDKEIDPQKERLELLEKSKNQEKKDMWDD